MTNLEHLPLGLYEKSLDNHLSWEEKLKLLKNAGFDYLEVSIDATPERICRLYQKEHAIALRNAIDKTGVPVYTMALTANRNYPLGSEDDSVRQKGIEIVELGIAFAEKVGIRVVHLAGYDEHGEKRNENTKQRFRDAISYCVHAAARRGVILAIETMDTSFMGSCSNIMQLCREIDSPYLQCYVDIGNLSASGIDISTDIPIAGKHIVGVHLKDTVPGVYRDVLFGDGNVDFSKCFRVLHNVNYSGFMVAEMWSYDDQRFHDYLPQASSFLREKLKNYNYK